MTTTTDRERDRSLDGIGPESIELCRECHQLVLVGEIPNVGRRRFNPSPEQAAHAMRIQGYAGEDLPGFAGPPGVPHDCRREEDGGLTGEARRLWWYEKVHLTARVWRSRSLRSARWPGLSVVFARRPNGVAASLQLRPGEATYEGLIPLALGPLRRRRRERAVGEVLDGLLELALAAAEREGGGA